MRNKFLIAIFLLLIACSKVEKDVNPLIIPPDFNAVPTAEDEKQKDDNLPENDKDVQELKDLLLE